MFPILCGSGPPPGSELQGTASEEWLFLCSGGSLRLSAPVHGPLRPSQSLLTLATWILARLNRASSASPL
jgi:hypothetical protein